MNFKNEWKKTVHREDLLPVLRSGFFMSMTGALIIGTLQVIFLFYFDFSFLWMFLIALAHLMSKRISRSYDRYHILYSFLSIFFFVFAYYLMNVVATFGIFFVMDIFYPKLILEILDPRFSFAFLNPLNQGFFYIDNILNVIFFLIGIVYSYRFSK